MYNEYDEYGYPLPRRRGLLSRLKWPLFALCILAVLAVRLWPDKPHKSIVKPPRIQTVKITDWSSIDASVREACEQAHDKARAYAEVSVTRWISELKARSDSDFLPWFFNYWNQQALALKAAGWYLADTTAAEVLIGEQDPAEERIKQWISDAFRARVLTPEHAAHQVETITRCSVEVYLVELRNLLDELQVQYGIPDMDWETHLESMASTALAVEARRQVPVFTKVAVASGGVAASKLVRTVIAHVRVLILRTTGRELAEGGFRRRMRYTLRHAGWVVAAVVGAWDVIDHQRTVQQNLPVMRRLVNDGLDELGYSVLNDSESGIYSVLERVRQ